jgi:hypothetical protein
MTAKQAAADIAPVVLTVDGISDFALTSTRTVQAILVPATPDTELFAGARQAGVHDAAPSNPRRAPQRRAAPPASPV